MDCGLLIKAVFQVQNQTYQKHRELLYKISTLPQNE
jgi:hypothetical protein